MESMGLWFSLAFTAFLMLAIGFGLLQLVVGIVSAIWDWLRGY